MIDLVVVVPCFNEGRRLRAAGFLPLLANPGNRVLFVNDGSTDDTGQVLDSICAELGPQALHLDLPRNQGKAEAVRQGLLQAIRMGAPVVGFLDADLATPAEEMLRLVSTLLDSRTQAAFAARVALLGTRIERHAPRHYLGRVFATAASLILDLPVYDTQCGAKAFRVCPQLEAALAETFHARWAFDVELIGRLLAGAPGIPGLKPADLLEMPLRAWTDVPDSKLRFAQFPSLGVELARIHLALRRRTARKQAVLTPVAPGPSRWMRSTVLLLAALLVLRSAGFVFGVVNIDESDFALIARRILHGAVLYRDVVDIKPPLAYLAFVPAAGSIWPMRVVGILWLLATALVVGRAARRLTSSGLAAACAPWLVLLAAQCELPSVSTELLMALPVAGALLFFVRAETGGGCLDQAICGACIAIASLFRQQAGILLGAFGLALCLRALRARDLRALARPAAMTAGFAIPWVLVVAAFGAAGTLPEFWDWVFTRNLQYAAGGSAWGALERAAQSIPLCVGAAIVPWVLAIRETFWPGSRGTARLGVVLALWSSWIAVSLGGRFYEHYFLQFVAPLALLAAPQAAELAQSWSTLSRRWRAAIVAGCALPALILCGYSFGRGLAGKYPEQEPRARALAAWLAKNTGPADRLFVWGHYSPIYSLSGRIPGTRYLTTSVLVGNFDPEHLSAGMDLRSFRSERDVTSTLQDLEANQVAIVVDTAPSGIHDWNRVPLSTVPALEQYVQSHYALAAEVAGARIYRRHHFAGR